MANRRSTRIHKHNARKNQAFDLRSITKTLNQVARMLSNFRGINGIGVRCTPDKILIDGSGIMAEMTSECGFQYTPTINGTNLESRFVPGTVSAKAYFPSYTFPTVNSTAMDAVPQPFITDTLEAGTYEIWLKVEISGECELKTASVEVYKPSEAAPTDTAHDPGPPSTDGTYYFNFAYVNIAGTVGDYSIESFGNKACGVFSIICCPGGGIVFTSST